MFTYIRSVKCNIQSINGKNSPANIVGLFIVKIPKTNIIIPLCILYYIPQNTIIQTALKHYNQFKSVRTKALRWLHHATDTGKKLKVETTVK